MSPSRLIGMSFNTGARLDTSQVSSGGRGTSRGVALIKPLTETGIKSDLSAAAAVGDDQIQEAATGSVNDCDTFSTSQL